MGNMSFTKYMRALHYYRDLRLVIINYLMNWFLIYIILGIDFPIIYELVFARGVYIQCTKRIATQI